MTSEKTIKINGIISKLLLTPQEGGFFIAKVILTNGDSNNEPITIKGYCQSAKQGFDIKATGQLVKDYVRGDYYKCNNITCSRPSSPVGITKYLMTLDGIGEKTAVKIANHFGASIFDIVKENPERLSEIPKLSPGTIKKVIAAITPEVKNRDLQILLMGFGLSQKKIEKIYQKYGEKTRDTLYQNPYCIIHDVRGIGFRIADNLAKKIGIASDDPFRIRAAANHILSECVGNGACGMPLDVCLKKTQDILTPAEQDNEEISNKLSIDEIKKIVVQNSNKSDAFFAIKNRDGIDCIYQMDLYKKEKLLADIISDRSLGRKFALPPHINELIDLAESSTLDGKTLHSKQREAVLSCLSNYFSIITGGPGMGKTTIVRVIVAVLKDLGITNILLCAPTGRAAQRASESAKLPGMTIHKLLEPAPGGGFKRNKLNPLVADLIIIDEGSMVGVSLMHDLLSAISPNTRILILGDKDQLLSVEAGRVFADLIESGKIVTSRLEQPFRTGKASLIYENAAKVNAGLMPSSEPFAKGDDYYFDVFHYPKPKIVAHNKASIANGRLEKRRARHETRVRISEKIPKYINRFSQLSYDPIKDIQILSPTKKGVLGTENLNQLLQSQLNPPRSGNETIVFGKSSLWRLRDKVMQTRNDYDKNVFNGDLGYITEVDSVKNEITVSFDNKNVTYTAEDIADLDLAYAMTIHKSQGSEFPVVIMPLDMSHMMNLKRSLLYTGMTRAKKMLLLAGNLFAVKKAVRRVEDEERYSMLSFWLRH